MRPRPTTRPGAWTGRRTSRSAPIRWPPTRPCWCWTRTPTKPRSHLTRWWAPGPTLRLQKNDQKPWSTTERKEPKQRQARKPFLSICALIRVAWRTDFALDGLLRRRAGGRTATRDGGARRIAEDAGFPCWHPCVRPTHCRNAQRPHVDPAQAGQVTAIETIAGQRVKRGATLLVLETDP